MPPCVAKGRRWILVPSLAISHSSLGLTLALCCALACLRVGHAAADEAGPGAIADALPAQLAWEAPDECPTAHGVLERLTDLLGQTPADWSRYERVSVAMQRDPKSGWLLLLTLKRDGDIQQRTLSAPRCEELGNAAAVALAIALGDDDRAESELAFTPAEPTAVTPSATPADTKEPAPPARRATPASIAIVAGAEAVLDVRSLGESTFGVGLHGDVHIARFAAGLYGVLLPGRSELVGDGNDQSVDFALIAGGARTCYRVLATRAHADACAAFELGSLSADARGLTAAQDTHDLWLATGLGLELGWDLTPLLVLSARVEGLLPLVTESYLINTTETVSSTPDATLRAAMGLAVQFR